MDTTAFKNRPQWIIIGTVVLAAAIGGALRIVSVQGANQSNAPEAPIPAETPASAATTPELFQSPMVTLSAELRKAATPSELVNSTAGEDRLAVVTTGRSDPFAPITTTISATTSASRRSEPPVATATPVNPSVAALPTAPVSSVPDLPPVPNLSYAPPPLPSIPMASSPVPIPSLPSSLPPASPTPQNPVQAIELTGVVQVGDRVGVIVREGNGQTSRHLFVGDLLAGGQVRVKSIDVSAQEPMVILEYQGKEYTRMVG